MDKNIDYVIACIRDDAEDKYENGSYNLEVEWECDGIKLTTYVEYDVEAIYDTVSCGIEIFGYEEPIYELLERYARITNLYTFCDDGEYDKYDSEIDMSLHKLNIFA